MKILIPMAGEGSRFAKEGYKFPKPLIDINGKPMIQRVVENLFYLDNKNEIEYIFLVRSEHLEKYVELENILNNISKKCRIIKVNNLTDGAACTALLAKNFINDDDELLIANSDQIIEYQPENFKILKSLTCVDGIIFTFNSVHPKWSFVKLNSNDYITEVAEKKPISNIATCGIYWYRKGKYFVEYAEKMIEKNIRVNNEFYIAPVYNEFIKDNKTLIPFYVNNMYGIGTPEDLNEYLNKKA